jgi:tetratricopeptide (TPR) repeat protein
MSNIPARQLRPLSTSQVLDTTVQLTRAYAWPLLAYVLLVQLPIASIRAAMYFSEGYHPRIWQSLLPIRAEVFTDTFELASAGIPLGMAVRLGSLDLALLLAVQLVLTAMLIPYSARIYLHRTGFFQAPRTGGPLDFLALAPAVLLAFPAMALSALIASALKWAALALLGGSEQADAIAFIQETNASYMAAIIVCLVLIVAFARFQVAGQATVLEERGMRGGLARSWQLTRRAFPQTLTIVLFASLLTGVLVALLPILALLLVEPRPTPLARTIHEGADALAQMVLGVMAPLQICALTVHYYNLRVRHEAFDIEMQAQQAARAEAQVLYERGHAKYQEQDFDGALADLEQAVALDPQHQGALYYQVALKEERGDLPGALATADLALERFPDDPTAFANRGYIRSRLGDRQGAREDYDEALKRRPDDRPALVKSIRLRYAEGDLDGALLELEYLLKIAPAHDWALYNAACIYARWGRVEIALERLAGAIGLDERWQHEAQNDSDFASLRDEPRFIALVSGTFDEQTDPAAGVRTDGAVL